MSASQEPKIWRCAYCKCWFAVGGVPVLAPLIETKPSDGMCIRCALSWKAELDQRKAQQEATV